MSERQKATDDAVVEAVRDAIRGQPTLTKIATAAILAYRQAMRERGVVEQAIWLRRKGDHVVVLIEHNGKWVELIREYLDSKFSHIIEPAGIARAILSAVEGE